MSALSEHYAGKECPGDKTAIDDRVWVIAARLANIAEPDDPHARFELTQAIVDLVTLAISRPQQTSEAK